MMPRRVTAAPGKPAAWYPITATNSTLGPGEACAMAIEALNCESVSSPIWSTMTRCMSGATVIAPPIASSDSNRKWPNSASQSTVAACGGYGPSTVASDIARRRLQAKTQATTPSPISTHTSGQRSSATATNANPASPAHTGVPIGLTRRALASMQRGAADQPSGDRTHPLEGAGHRGMQGVLRIHRRHHQHDRQRHRHHPRQSGEGAAPAEEAVADHQRHVAHVGARQDLADREDLQELLASEPAPLIAEHALGNRQHAAEALQGQERECDEQVFRGLGPGKRRWIRWS